MSETKGKSEEERKAEMKTGQELYGELSAKKILRKHLLRVLIGISIPFIGFLIWYLLKK